MGLNVEQIIKYMRKDIEIYLISTNNQIIYKGLVTDALEELPQSLLEQKVNEAYYSHFFHSKEKGHRVVEIYLSIHINNKPPFKQARVSNQFYKSK